MVSIRHHDIYYGVSAVVKRLCNHCWQEIKEGEKICSLCRNPYDPIFESDDYEPVKKRVIPTKLQLRLSKGIVAIIASAVVAIGIAAAGIWMYLQNPETPERVALNGLYVLFNADIREFAARHAFVEADIGLAIRTTRANSWDDAVEPMVWEKYNELEDILSILEKNDIKLSIQSSEEITGTDKDITLKSILANTISDPERNPERAEMLNTINNNVSRLYRVDVEAAAVGSDTLDDIQIIVYAGMIDGKWSILSEIKK